MKTLSCSGWFRWAGAPVVVGLLSASAQVAAQSWPSGPVRIVVPFAAGGTSDILARVISPRLGEALGQPVLVENRPGANGNIGAEAVARAAPDGQTLLLADLGAIAINPAIYKMNFDVVRDFAGVSMVAYSPHLLVVHPSVPAKSVRELIALARANPGKLNFAASGIGGPPHLAGVAFEQQAGVKWTYVPYKGGAAAMIDLAGGHAEVAFNGMLATYPFVRGGKLRLLAVSSAERYPSIPEVPTLRELGLRDFETGSWQGILTAAASPRPALERLHAELGRILNTPDTREFLAKQGAQVSTMAPDELTGWMKRETAKWGEVVRKAGIKIE